MLKVISTGLSIVLALILIGQLKNYSISLINLVEVIIFSWVLYPLVKSRVTQGLIVLLNLLKEEGKDG